MRCMEEEKEKERENKKKTGYEERRMILRRK